MFLETGTTAAECILQTQHTEPNVDRIAGHDAVNNEKRIKTNIDVPYETNNYKTNEPNSFDENNDDIVMCFLKVNLNELPADLQLLLPAVKEHLPDDYGIPSHMPDWLDIEQVKKGQQFAHKYLYGLNYSQTLSLLFLFANPGGITALIHTEKSHTASLAYKRYLSTVLRVQSWYDTEFWKPGEKGYKNLKCVRALHLNTSKQLNSQYLDDVYNQANLAEKLKKSGSNMLCPLLSTLKRDFDNSETTTCPVYMKKTDRIHFNQLEMAITQFGFFGLIVVYPDKFAGKNATKEEIASFIHLWRYLGYLLGIKDEFNLCQGDVDTVLKRCRHITDYVIRPTILKVSEEWEHMSRCALQGIEKFTKLRINFEATILYLCWVLDIKTPYLLQSVGWKELMLFNLTKLSMCDGPKIPGFVKLFNYHVRKTLENAEKQNNKNSNDKKQIVTHL